MEDRRTLLLIRIGIQTKLRGNSKQNKFFKTHQMVNSEWIQRKTRGKKQPTKTTIWNQTKRRLIYHDSDGEDETSCTRPDMLSFSSFSSSLPPDIDPSSVSFLMVDLYLWSPTTLLSWSVASSLGGFSFSRSFLLLEDEWFERWGPGVKSGDRRGFEKESGAVNGKAGTGKVKWEGDKDGRAEELGKALRSAAEEGGPSLPLSPPLALPPLVFLLLFIG